jgi:uncharacterized integral membrane protein (TIGR00701 family)
MLWIKAFHIVFMVSWFAGLFYLPRIFVYHAGHPSGPVHEQFCVMERKLYRFIMTPAMVLTVALGLWLTGLEWAYLKGAGWFWAKLALVAALVKTQGSQRFSEAVLTNSSGFAGIDGIFRFRPDGTNERGLAVLRVGSTGGQTVSPAPRSFRSGT